MSKIQQTATNKPKATEKKPLQTIEEKPALPAVQYDNPWLEAAAEAGSEFGKILKFNKGEWPIGEDTVPEGTEYIAYVDELARAWIKFEDGTVADRRVVKVRDGKLPPRAQLGDNDKSKWEIGDDGERRDPWVLQWLLPMSRVDAEGDFTVFATSSKGGIGAIGLLCKVYGRSPRNGLLPIVALKSASYKHPQYGKVLKPYLPIVGQHGTPTPPAQPASDAADFNNPIDTIPFN
jgi:hypothetical protein